VVSHLPRPSGWISFEIFRGLEAGTVLTNFGENRSCYAWFGKAAEGRRTTKREAQFNDSRPEIYSGIFII
jgi:hypothetical protein